VIVVQVIRRRWVLLLAIAVTAGAIAAAWVATPAAVRLRERAGSLERVLGARPLPLSAISPWLREAVVATEDERFYRHHGIDVIGVLRALPYDLSHLSLAQGASTITEQTAKLVYLRGDDHTPWRKLEDALLAVKLEQHYSKQQILAAYLDVAYFGGGAYGIARASERYFGVRPVRLSLAQASLLAGLLQSPSRYDPLRAPALARARQVAVLRSLVRNGYATGDEAAAAVARPLPLRGAPPLRPLGGVSLTPGPAFAWGRLAAGAVLALAGLLAFVLRRLVRAPARAVTATVALLALAVGLAIVVRSFRVV
jgi:membrane peptidoglycan carboxypeptidase